MAEEMFNDSVLDLKELELKVGRKTPDCLLTWMKDATDCPEERDDSALSDKIHNLKQDMRALRCTDVRILRQLVAIHEGIEAVRWLVEERGALASHGSSLTGSLSSLVTVEEPGASVSPCRDSPSLTFLQDVTEEESADQPPPADVEHSHKSPAVSSTSRQNFTDPLQGALFRSLRVSHADGRDNPTEDNMAEHSGSLSKEALLLAYDAQWCWVESQDDVTYL
ncbi:leucine rich adaptor protein 1-like [Synchiropus picturatus]